MHVTWLHAPCGVVVRHELLIRNAEANIWNFLSCHFCFSHFLVMIVVVVVHIIVATCIVLATVPCLNSCYICTYLCTCASRVSENILFGFSHFLSFCTLLIPFHRQRVWWMAISCFQRDSKEEANVSTYSHINSYVCSCVCTFLQNICVYVCNVCYV